MNAFGSANMFALNPIAAAIANLYRVAGTINDFLDSHIAAMKGNANATVRATGNVLEGAKFGFGLGYMTSLVIIAIGQIILGNPLSAVLTTSGAALGFNPIAMTCGAIGAIFYGWRALSEGERNAIVNRITDAFEVGAELIKAVVNFVLSTLGQLLSAENLEEYKRIVATTASQFGKSLSDVTRSVKDRVADAALAVSSAVGKSADFAFDGVSSAAVSLKKNASLAAATLVERAENASEYLRGSNKKD